MLNGWSEEMMRPGQAGVSLCPGLSGKSGYGSLLLFFQCLRNRRSTYLNAFVLNPIPQLIDGQLLGIRVLF